VKWQTLTSSIFINYLRCSARHRRPIRCFCINVRAGNYRRGTRMIKCFIFWCIMGRRSKSCYWLSRSRMGQHYPNAHCSGKRNSALIIVANFREDYSSSLRFCETLRFFEVRVLNGRLKNSEAFSISSILKSYLPDFRYPNHLNEIPRKLANCSSERPLLCNRRKIFCLVVSRLKFDIQKLTYTYVECFTQNN